jgi:hypothetical protein
MVIIIIIIIIDVFVQFVERRVALADSLAYRHSWCSFHDVNPYEVLLLSRL